MNHTKLKQWQILIIVTSCFKESTIHISINYMSWIDPGLLARTVKKLEVSDVQDTELSQQKVIAIIRAVSISNKLTELHIGENALSIVDLGLLTKVVSKLVRLEL